MMRSSLTTLVVTLLSIITCLATAGSLLPSSALLRAACSDGGVEDILDAAKEVSSSSSDTPRASYLLAAALFLDAGDPWASRDAIMLAAAEKSLHPSLGARDALHAMRAADALSRVGEWRSARALHRALLADGPWSEDDVDTDDANDAEIPTWVRSLSLEIKGIRRRDVTLSSTPSSSSSSSSSGGDGDYDDVLIDTDAAYSSLPTTACAATKGVSARSYTSDNTPASSSTTATGIRSSIGSTSSVTLLPDFMRLVAAAIADGERGAYDDARQKLSVATKVVSTTSTTTTPSPRVLCAHSIVHMVERLVEGARVSAVGPAAALLEWQWEWAPGLLSISPLRLSTSASTASESLSIKKDDAASGGDEAANAAAAAAAMCGAGAVRGVGGWADVAHALLESDNGASGAHEAATGWTEVANRATRALGDSHVDSAAAHIVLGSLLVAAGDDVGAVMIQRSARAALVSAAGGNKSRAELSRGYARSLMSSGEALLSSGEAARAAKYFLSARDAAEQVRGGIPPAFAATAAGLFAVSFEDAAFAHHSAGCRDYLVCFEGAARAAATDALVAYDAGENAWASVPAATRAANVDATAFSALSALAHSRARAGASPSNHSQLEAVALYALLGGGGYSMYELARSGSGSGSNAPQASLFLAATALGARALDSVGDPSAAIAYLAAAERALGTGADCAQTLLDKAGLALSARAVANGRLRAQCKGSACATRRVLAAEAVSFFSDLGARRANGTGWATTVTAVDGENNEAARRGAK